MIHKLLSLFLVLFLVQNSFAQHINIDKKALAFLTSEEKVNVNFYYTDLIIDETAEEDFLKKMWEKVERLENAPNADAWSKSYYDHKDSIWPQMFLNTLNEKLSEYKNSPEFVESSEAKYTMNVYATWMYFGYDASIIARPAKVTLTITFVNNDHPQEILNTLEISRAMGTYNKKDGDGEGAGPSLNRMGKAYFTAAYKYAKALKRVVD